MIYDHLHDENVTEFECTDCKIEVIGLGAHFIHLPPRCGTCQWISEIADPVARERVRKHLAIDELGDE